MSGATTVTISGMDIMWPRLEPYEAEASRTVLRGPGSSNGPRLPGGGDEGTVELNHVLYGDGRYGEMPTVTVGITDAGGTISLDERLENLIYDVPDGDWINNEGGHGTVILRPQETDPDYQVECDMTYGDDGEGNPDFEDEDFEDEVFASDVSGADPDGELIAIDDSTLQPATGDDQ